MYRPETNAEEEKINEQPKAWGLQVMAVNIREVGWEGVELSGSGEEPLSVIMNLCAP
jgi:hypothetical protein